MKGAVILCSRLTPWKNKSRIRSATAAVPIQISLSAKQFAPLWRELADHHKVLFPDGDDEGVFIISALDARSQILSIKNRRNGIGKRFSNLLHLEADNLLPLLRLICVSLVFLLKFCNGFSLKLTGLMCDGRPLASPLFSRLAGRGAIFCGFPFRWVLHFVVFLIRGVALHESSSCSKGSRPHMFYDVPVQRCNMPPSRIHVLRLAY